MLNRTEKVCLVITAIVLFSASILIGSYLKAEQSRNLASLISKRLTEDITKIQTSLQIDITGPDGNIKTSLHKDDDLILTNLINMFAGMVTDSNGETKTFSSTDTGGTSRTLNIKINAQSGSHCIYHSGGTTNMGGYIQIGTGSTAAARSNYVLVTPVESLTSVGASPTYTDGNITVSAAIGITADRSLREAGFFCTWLHSASAQSTHMLFRDVYDAVAVTTGDTCTVTYTVNLSTTGFNDNLGEILEELFTNVIAGATTTITLTDTAGSAQTVNAWGQSYTHLLFDRDVANPETGIQVGTGTSAVGRSNYTLAVAVESLTANSVPVITGTSNITTASVITMTDSRTITEAGFFLKTKNTAGTDKTFMLWRTTFAGVVVSNGNTITITFIIILIVIPLDFFKKREEYMF